MTTKVERRNLLRPVELRAADDGEPSRIAEGYAAVFGKRSSDLLGFTEVVDSGAFAKTLADGADVVSLWQHRDEALLGRTSSGTLRIATDDRGLRYDVDLPNTTAGNDVHELMRRKDVRASSFGFRTIRDQWEEAEDGAVTRTLLEVALIDVSPVTRAAYPDADVALRSLAAAIEAPIERVRDAAEHRSLAELLEGATVPGVEPGDPDDPDDRNPTIVGHRPSWFYA